MRNQQRFTRFVTDRASAAADVGLRAVSTSSQSNNKHSFNSRQLVSLPSGRSVPYVQMYVSDRASAAVDADVSMVSTLSPASNNSFHVSQHVRLPSGRSIPYVQMMERMKRILPPEDLRFHMTVYKNRFRADDAIKAFRVHFRADIHNDEAAIAFGRTLQRVRILTHVVDAEKSFRAGHYFFRLQCFQQPHILNSYRISMDNEVCEEGDPMRVLEVIACRLLDVVNDITDNDIGFTDYRAASKSTCFPLFEDALCQVQRLDLGALPEMTRIAVAINLYNFAVKYAFMKVGAPVKRSARGIFFSDLKINVGGNLLSLDDLEHGILRGNRPKHGSTKSAYFAAGDPRLRLVPSREVDPRIHFAIQCTPMAPSRTSMVYADTLDQDLQREARRYLSDPINVLIDHANHTVHLNQIFQWYSRDFYFRGSQDWPRLARLLLANLEAPSKKKQEVQSMLVLSEDQWPRMSYIPFDWGKSAGNFTELKTSAIKANEKRVVPSTS